MAANFNAFVLQKKPSQLQMSLGQISKFGQRSTQRRPDPLKSTVELGYLDTTRICNNGRYPEVGPELLCSICHNVLWKPIACATCENSFCAGCIRTWIDKQISSWQRKCPFNCTFQEKRAPPILNSFLSKLQVSCAYAPNGCGQVLAYDALEKHEETCLSERTPCNVCNTPVSLRDQNNKHELRQCFKQMYDRNPDHVQAQFIKLLDVVEASQQRIQELEKRLAIESQKNQWNT